MTQAEALPSSYRDPDGFLFRQNNGLFRQINSSYAPFYKQFKDSGLYQRLQNLQSLVKHEETDILPVGQAGWLVIKPEVIPFISYPYEWSFSQLKDAALLTLQVQQEAIAHGMTLKDASAYNVQFLRGKPIFIDTLSFTIYQEGQPWVAYRQFCEHFLVPLALMAHKDIRLQRLLLSNIEGIPLELGSKLLPWPTYFNMGILLHVHLHAKAQKKFTDGSHNAISKGKGMSRNALLQLLENLESTITSLSWTPDKTLWADYYAHTNYQDEAMRQKEQEVSQLLKRVQPSFLWDLGANTGRFSQLALQVGAQVIAMDFDMGATELHYLESKKQGQPTLPLVMDLTQPSPAIGWKNQERESLLQRPKPDTVLALALVHHLAISHNLPLPHLASLFSQLCHHLIIEFVTNEDSQVQRLLTYRKDTFLHYTQEKFEDAFLTYFSVLEQKTLIGGTRTLYLFQVK